MTNYKMNLPLLKHIVIAVIAMIQINACTSSDNNNDEPNVETPISFYYGADLSYVNEMEDCGAVYKNADGTVTDVYQIFKNEGANLVRVRLWHNPQWTNYSNYEDVKLAIQRAKNNGFKVLLDFHYSDTWADPSKQEIPAAWASQINNTPALGNLLYNYTYDTLENLADLNLLPDMVQVGNEINPMILQQGDLVWPIDWERNSALLNKGIQAVRDISNAKNKTIEIMLHIAQPENGLWWFEQAADNGVTDFDWIGLSYYPQWSDYNLSEVQTPLATLINTYNKKLMIVETAYPYTLNDVDNAGNILGTNAMIDGYPATEQGQLNYLNDLTQAIKNAGGEGLVYWEPAWVSTDCFTLWGQGSHWDNATLFDQENKANLGMKFYNNALDE
ncbi:glycoside hydrolase family 53 protein [Winogradskyella tangerina]|uniref:glycoside hydrolase family 53 protein n=1 Tax=Winogradskyella tangerina TaxID=2023240 RepID=UPI000DBE2BDE|nr:glycosyl hydrolase 53 family protein [Winogradskyella tangerina]